MGDAASGIEQKTDSASQKVEAARSSSGGEEQDPKGPIPPFLALTDSMASDAWVPDTARMNEKKLYPGYAEAEVRMFEGRPFYRLKPKKTRVLSGMGHRQEDHQEALEVFREAKGVWGYFYRLDSAKVMITDGAIEQWLFKDRSQVDEALQALERVDHAPFFNTRPYFHKSGHYLLIFHARSMGFSYEQKELFKQYGRIEERMTLDHT